MRKLFLIFFSFISGLAIFAGNENTSHRISGAQVFINAISQAQDYRFVFMANNTPPNWGFENTVVSGYLDAGINTGSLTYVSSAFDIDLVFDVTYHTWNGSAFVSNTDNGRILQVKYDPTAATLEIERARRVYPGAHRVRAKLTAVYLHGTSTSVSPIPLNLYSETGVLVERFHTFSETTIPSAGPLYNLIDLNGDLFEDEIEVTWPYFAGAEEYDLEWTVVNDYRSSNQSQTVAASEIEFTLRDFELNCTRVRVTDNNFRIPILFDRGFVVLRYRPISRGGPTAGDYSKVVYGRWSSDALSSPANISQFTQHYFYYSDSYAGDNVTGGHEKKKNWQVTSTFAEDGKKKEVISYFDGTLRNRQTVTRVNSGANLNNQVVIGETIYDYQGRPAVQVLPSPISTNSTGSTAIKFYPYFNIATAGAPAIPYTKLNFDVDPTACQLTVSLMDSTSGASRYYSSYNNLVFPQRDYLPTSKGFPFTMVEYEPDNTNRVRAQTGVGGDHKYGSNHETKYFYGQPEQEQLDRLFATEVGYAQHYKKNMVIDANGQISVSYLDMQGRVIATSLAGDSTSNLLALRNPVTNASVISDNSSSITVDLLNKYNVGDTDTDDDNNIMSLDTMELKYSAQKLVASSGTYNFYYSLTNTSFTDPCITPDCYPLVYDLSINVRDQCGVQKLTTPVSTTINSNYASQPHNCNNISTSYDQTAGLQALNLAPGQYTVEKTLKVNQQALDFFANYFVTDADTTNCILTKYDFIAYQLTQVDLDNCDITCAECVANLTSVLGTRSAYGTTQAKLDEWDAIYNDCNEPCSTPSQCQEGYKMMLQDVSPEGQYGATSSSAGDFIISVFNTSNDLPDNNGGTPPDWKNPSPEYTDELGQTAYIPVVHLGSGIYDPPVDPNTPVTINGQEYVKPHQLANVSDFVNLWQPSWAKALVKYHPEYAYYVWCDPLKNLSGSFCYSADEFDYAIMTINTYAGAQSAMIGTCTTAVNLVAAAPTPATFLALDPFFVNTSFAGPLGTNNPCTGQTYYLDMLGKMTNYLQYQTGPNLFFTMTQAATFTVNCGTWYGNNYVTAPCPGWNAAFGTTGNTNMEWQHFIGYYIGEKQKIMQAMSDQVMVNAYVSSSTTDKSYCGCIGEKDYNPFSACPQTPVNHTSIPLTGSPVIDSDLPCSLYDYYMYKGKARRYGFNDLVPDKTHNQNQVDYQLYQQTGLCPKAIQFQALLNGVIPGGFTTNQALLGIHGLTPNLYTAVTNLAVPGPLPLPANQAYVALQWTPAGTGATLTITFLAPPPAGCNNITVTLPTSSGLAWSGYGTTWRLESFTDIQATGSGNYNIKAKVDHDMTAGTAAIDVIMSGNTCLGIDNCSGGFVNQCYPSDELNDLQDLMNALSANSVLNNTGVTITTTAPYSTIFKRLLMSYLPYTASPNWLWKWDGTAGAYRIYDGGTSFPNDYLEFKFTVGQITGTNPVFSNAIPNNAFSGANDNAQMDVSTMNPVTKTFYMKDFTTGGSSVYISSGTCQLPVPGNCLTKEHRFKKELLDLLNAYVPFGSTSPREPNNSSAANKHFLTGTQWFSQEMHNYLAITGNENFGAHNGVINATQFTIPIKDLNNPDGPVFCQLDLYAVNSYNVLPNCTTITAFSNLIVDAITYTNGQNYEFTVTATAGGNSYVIRGKACFPMRNCKDCGFDQAPALVDCQTNYNTYVSFLTTKGWQNDPAFTYTQADFCYFGLEDHSTSYISYLSNSVLNITNSSSPHYVSLKQYAQGGYTDCAGDYIYYHTQCSTYLANNPTLKIYISQFCQTGYGNTCGVNYKAFTDIGANPEITILEFCNGYPIETPCKKMPKAITVPAITQPANPCSTYQNALAAANGLAQYNAYLAGIKDKFKRDYALKCMKDAVERFEMTYTDKEYHFTLYYYDQGGNLGRTIPPSGVNKVNLGTYGAQIKSDRKNNPNPRNVFTSHLFATTYKYNSLNQLREQITPDGGLTKFWYDDLGRLVVSQNAKQIVAANWPNTIEVYSYTVYDALGRIVAVGQAQHPSGTPMTETISKNPSSLSAWIAAATKTEVTKTFYDAVAITLSPNPFGSPGQENLRNRISAVTFQKTYTSSDQTFDHGTHYSYDIHGNVKVLVQDKQEIAALSTSITNQRFKRTDYLYDLVSGKVNEVQYQSGSVDQLFHKYWYDGDNRITNVYTSQDKVFWDQDAKYFYYPHGPLARVELGHNKVQGNDYAYTIHGWIKGVNSNTLKEHRDPGKDGYVTTTNLNQFIGQDESGYSLAYYASDYGAIGQFNSGPLSTNDNMFLLKLNTTSDLHTASPSLYNGNIRHMVTAIRYFMSGANPPEPFAYAYHYDQLNRIKQLKMFNNADVGTNNQWNNTSQNNTAYLERFRYDHNGNILQLFRNGLSPTSMDDLKYYYYTKAGTTYDPQTSTPNDATNRLAYVTDPTAPGNYAVDIDNQSANNYLYDEIGNMKGDAQEQINTINWTVYGKVSTVTRTAGSNKDDLEFKYDAMGNRIAKIVKPRSGGNPSAQSAWVYTLYDRDAQGNTMGIYKLTGITATVNCHLNEQHIYGSSRIGIGNRTVNMLTATLSTTNFQDTAGMKTYEQTNHLGNVLTVVSDQRKPVDVGSNGTVDYYAADLQSAQDYYSFGMLMPGRNYNSSTYRAGFNGMEKMDELHGNTGDAYDFGARVYDARLGKWLSVDPLFNDYHFCSPFSFALNTPIQAIDPNGELVIFIGGMHNGTQGGESSYWRGTIQVPYHEYNPFDEEYRDEPSGYIERKVDMVSLLSEQFRDNHYKFKDGSVGGAPNVSNNINPEFRYSAGMIDGVNDANSIIASLKRDENGNIIETIKVVSHSMGGVYAKGYVLGVLAYAAAHKIEGVKFDIELDLAPFDATHKRNTPIKGIPTFVGQHGEDWVAGNDPSKYNSENTLNTDYDLYDYDDGLSAHSILGFEKATSNIGEKIGTVEARKAKAGNAGVEK